jgi:hypothetical protein
MIIELQASRLTRDVLNNRLAIISFERNYPKLNLKSHNY